MIKDVVSATARLPLAQARLTGRVAGSLLRKVRGDGADDPQPEKSTAGAKQGSGRGRPASRRRQTASHSRPKARQGRAAARTGTKARAKRTTGRTPAKATTKRRATGGAKARPKRPPQPVPVPVDEAENLPAERREPAGGGTGVPAVPQPAAPAPPAGSDTADTEPAPIGGPTPDDSPEQEGSTGQRRFTRQKEPDLADIEKDPADPRSDPSVRGI